MLLSLKIGFYFHCQWVVITIVIALVFFVDIVVFIVAVVAFIAFVAYHNVQHLRNKTSSLRLHSLVKSETNVWKNSRADQ